MYHPKISIVTSSYQQGGYIHQTIESVVSQDYDNLEYIIIDGGSTDDTIDKIKNYEDRIFYWESVKDNGCADALNKGLDKATGDYFLYINSDDYFCDQSIVRFVEAVKARRDFEVIHGHGFTHDEISSTKYSIYSSRWSASGYLDGSVSLIQPSTIFKLDFIRRNRIRFNTLNRSCWDSEFIVDLALAGARFSRLPFNEKLSNFRVHKNSITGSQTLANRYQEDISRIRSKLFNSGVRRRITGRRVAQLFLDPFLYLNRVVAKFDRRPIAIAS